MSTPAAFRPKNCIGRNGRKSWNKHTAQAYLRYACAEVTEHVAWLFDALPESIDLHATRTQAMNMQFIVATMAPTSAAVDCAVTRRASFAKTKMGGTFTYRFPVLNRAGELVGINFDRNRHGLVRNFVYTDVMARHIAVHSRGVLEALRTLYDCEPLVRELTGS